MKKIVKITTAIFALGIVFRVYTASGVTERGLTRPFPAGGTVLAPEFDHLPWDRVLKEFVTETGRVDYAALKANSADLDRYAAQLAARSPVSHPEEFPTRNSQLAYWINAYNALVMKGVIEKWPIKSVLDIGFLPHSFFWRKKFFVGGEKYTLNTIEKDMLRQKLAEPRIHFALACASNSCPRLQRVAYSPENTERLLEEAARFFINEPRNLKIEASQNRVTVSRIFTWYRKDFENYVRARNISGNGNLLLDYVRLYANETNRRALDALRKPRVEAFHYDWGINDVHTLVAIGHSCPLCESGKHVTKTDDSR